MFGKVEGENTNLPDLSWREKVTLIPLIVMAFWIGIYPAPFLKMMEKPVKFIVSTVSIDEGTYRAEK
jgi:NADH-quinone oxidoreductase subunit M